MTASRRPKPKSQTAVVAPTLPTDQRRDWSLIIAFIGIFVVTLIVYLPALHGGFIWDDDAHITKPQLRSLYGLWRIWFEMGATQQYYPLVHSAFWFEHKLWGDVTTGYHVVNILIHAANACLVALILRQLKIPGALLAALIFALHPVEVETVAWITELKNTLSGFFYLSAALLYLQFDQNRKMRFYFVALLLFIFALLSKTVTATLPAALLVIFWWQRGELRFRRDILPLLPWFPLAVAGGLLTAWVERKFIGAQGGEFEMSLIQRCLVAGRVIWFYLGKLAWPSHLIFIYPHWDVDPKQIWQFIFPIAAIGLAFGLWRIRHWSRGPLAAFLFFVGTLFPALGFFNVAPFMYSFVAGHFQYLAGLGMITLASAGATIAVQKYFHAKWFALPAAGVVLAVLTALTFAQAHEYGNIEILYRSTIEQNPGCWMAHNNLGAVLTNSNRPAEAIEHFKIAAELRPNNFEAFSNIGNALISLGQYRDAIHYYEQAIRTTPSAGTHEVVVHNLRITLNNLAWLYATVPDPSLRDGPHAVQLAEQAVSLSPDESAELLDTLAASYAEVNRIPNAIAAAEHAIQLARESEQKELADQIQSRLNTYRKRFATSTTSASP